MLYGVVEFGKPQMKLENLRRQLVQMLRAENGDERLVIRLNVEATTQDVVRKFLTAQVTVSASFSILDISSFCLRYRSGRICHWLPRVFALLQQDCSKPK